MKSYKIAIIPGDGSGPEMLREGVKVLEAAAEKFSFHLDFTEFDYGGNHYLQKGEVLPDGAVEELMKYQAIFLGAIGHPEVKPGLSLIHI